MELQGATIVLESLLAENVDVIFGYPGGAIMPVYDALYDYKDQLEHVLVRHEQGAIHAAQGFARSSGRVGVCIATSGPGATNLITGLADAMIDSTPVVCITGQVTSDLLGTDAFQETDVIGISMPVTKWNIQVTKAEDIAPALARAFYIARTGRPGPVLVDITKDAQFGKSDFNYEACSSIRSYVPVPKVDLELLTEAATLLNEAEKPFLLIGQGIILSEAEEALMDFAMKTGIPIASTLLGLGSFPADHELYVGYLGMHGNYAPNLLTNECDVLLAIGMRFDDRVTGDVERYACQAKVIHVDIDKAELNKIIEADLAIHGDARTVLELLLPHVHFRRHTTWLNKFRTLEVDELMEVINPAINPTSEALKMSEVIHQLSEKTNGNAIVVTDVGQHQMITSRYYKYLKKKSSITSGGLGTMGFALPASIGAKFGAQNKEVIAVIGDGGFQMNIQELGTVMQSGVVVKIIVLNNNFLGMVRQWQEMFFEKRYSFTDIQNPDFIMIAKGYGITGKKITRRNDLEGALSDLLAHKESYLLEVEVEQEGNVFPMMAPGASVAEMRLH